jgi:type IV secretory pathway ATPase VirB11/archaellum biosynthesis ATPase
VDPMLAIAATAIFWIITGLATGPQVPSFFSASGNVPGMSTAQAMSRMSLFNALIILGIKVIMGATAQGISVQAVYGFPILSFVAAGLIARYVVRKNYKPENPDNIDSYPMTSPISVIAD